MSWNLAASEACFHNYTWYSVKMFPSLDPRNSHHKRHTDSRNWSRVPFHHSILNDGGISNLVLGYAHSGMVAAAHWIAKLCTPALLKALNESPDSEVKVLFYIILRRILWCYSPVFWILQFFLSFLTFSIFSLECHILFLMFAFKMKLYVLYLITRLIIFLPFHTTDCWTLTWWWYCSSVNLYS